MAKATIHSKTGAVITVEGTPREVSRILAQYNSSESQSEAGSVEEPKQFRARPKDEGRQSATDLVLDLKQHGFFEKPKTLAEIGSALEERGYLYPVTTLSGVVLRLLKRGRLRRKKADGRWVYGK